MTIKQEGWPPRVFVAHSLKLLKEAEAYEAKLGRRCYIPGRDTPQVSGDEIIRVNRTEMEKRDEVHIIGDGVSLGTLVDIGMAMGMRKPIYIAQIVCRSWTSYLMDGKIGSYLIPEDKK